MAQLGNWKYRFVAVDIAKTPSMLNPHFPRNLTEPRNLILWEPNRLKWIGRLGWVIFIWCLISGVQLFFRRVPLRKSELWYFSDFHHKCIMSLHINHLFKCTLSRTCREACFLFLKFLNCDIVGSRWIVLIFCPF